MMYTILQSNRSFDLERSITDGIEGTVDIDATLLERRKLSWFVPSSVVDLTMSI